VILNISRQIRHHQPIPIRLDPKSRPTPSCRPLSPRPILIDRLRAREVSLCRAARALTGFCPVDKEPTDDGKRLWPPDGYLRLNREAEQSRVACTCTEGCRHCKGECGCEACALGWLIYQDDQALWDENGDLVNVVDLGGAWNRVADPRQLRLRFYAEEK
jgi:hypothetical protein